MPQNLKLRESSPGRMTPHPRLCPHASSTCSPAACMSRALLLTSLRKEQRTFQTPLPPPPCASSHPLQRLMVKGPSSWLRHLCSLHLPHPCDKPKVMLAPSWPRPPLATLRLVLSRKCRWQTGRYLAEQQRGTPPPCPLCQQPRKCVKSLVTLVTTHGVLHMSHDSQRQDESGFSHPDLLTLAPVTILSPN